MPELTSADIRVYRSALTLGQTLCPDYIYGVRFRASASQSGRLTSG
jgi:hypothetical protein